jgi:hypothetical protein
MEDKTGKNRTECGSIGTLTAFKIDKLLGSKGKFSVFPAVFNKARSIEQHSAIDRAQISLAISNLCNGKKLGN